MPDRRYRVLYVLGHPVQYFSPVLRLLAQHPSLGVTTAYCRLHGATAAHDPEFGATVQWDVPVLDGYPWVEVPNKGTDSEGFWGLYNPGLWKLVREGNFDAVICITGYIRASFWITWFASKLSRSVFLFGTDTTTLRPRDASRWKVPVKHAFLPLLYRLATLPWSSHAATSRPSVLFLRASSPPALAVPRLRSSRSEFSKHRNSLTRRFQLEAI